MISKNSNQLAQETSPYLLQHASNPVDWRPWSDKTLAEAKKLGKPILLSIGYSACHWCHVMAHESFEDKNTAKLMNELFINVKIDREERPDIDQIYQTANMVLTRHSGGWPLTVFIDPASLAPFFSGTYFPPTARHGLPAFKDVLAFTHKYFVEEGEDWRERGEATRELLRRIFRDPENKDDLPQNLIELSCAQLLNIFDSRHGGLGGAPKFAQPALLNFLLLAHFSATKTAGGTSKPLNALLFSLDKIVRSGLRDHLGHGFFRYCVDELWMIPHFEKMLYDNAQLLELLASVATVEREKRYLDAAVSVGTWITEEMRHEKGGFFAALDADSEGEEGCFYTWTKNELDDCLDERERKLFLLRFSADGKENFEEKFHLHVAREQSEIEKLTGEKEANQTIDKARGKLLELRKLREPPGLDDNIICSWNAITIKGLARAALLLERPSWYKKARECLDFIHRHMWRENQLCAVWNKGRVKLSVHLDDYAFLLDAILAMLQFRWDSADMKFATELISVVLDKYEDTELGGYMYTPSDGEELFVRPRVVVDGVTPSGYGVAALSLARFGHLCAEPSWTLSAERALAHARQTIVERPVSCVTLVAAAREMASPATAVILRGEEKKMANWRKALLSSQHWNPRRIVLAVPKEIDDCPPWLKDKTAPAAGVSAYVCRGEICHEPVVNDLPKLFALLHSLETSVS